MQPFPQVGAFLFAALYAQHLFQFGNTVAAVVFGGVEHISHRVEAVFIHNQHKAVVDILPGGLHVVFLDIVRQNNRQDVGSVRPGILRRHAIDLHHTGNVVQSDADVQLLQDGFHILAGDVFLFHIVCKLHRRIFVGRLIARRLFHGIMEESLCAAPDGVQLRIFQQFFTAAGSFIKNLSRLFAIAVTLQNLCRILRQRAVAFSHRDDLGQLVQVFHEFVNGQIAVVVFDRWIFNAENEMRSINRFLIEVREMLPDFDFQRSQLLFRCAFIEKHIHMEFRSGRKSVFLLHVVAGIHDIKRDAGKCFLYICGTLPLFWRTVRQRRIRFGVVAVHNNRCRTSERLSAPVSRNQPSPCILAVCEFCAHMIVGDRLCQIFPAGDVHRKGIAGIRFYTAHAADVQLEFSRWLFHEVLPPSFDCHSLGFMGCYSIIFACRPCLLSGLSPIHARGRRIAITRTPPCTPGLEFFACLCSHAPVMRPACTQRRPSAGTGQKRAA